MIIVILGKGRIIILQKAIDSTIHNNNNTVTTIILGGHKVILRHHRQLQRILQPMYQIHIVVLLAVIVKLYFIEMVTTIPPVVGTHLPVWVGCAAVE